MSEPILFSVEDALDLQDLQLQRVAIEAQISGLIRKYGIEGPATVVQDSKGRWIGIQSADATPTLVLVPDDPSPPIDEVLAAKAFAKTARKKKTS